MRREACFVDAAYFDDRWHDQYAYAILKQDWALSATEKTITGITVDGENLPP